MARYYDQGMKVSRYQGIKVLRSHGHRHRHGIFITDDQGIKVPCQYVEASRYYMRSVHSMGGDLSSVIGGGTIVCRDADTHARPQLSPGAADDGTSVLVSVWLGLRESWVKEGFVSH
jgi:hypothetical protein